MVASFAKASAGQGGVEAANQNKPWITRLRVKSYGGQAADFTDWDCGGSRVGCFGLEQAARLPLQLSYFSATGYFGFSTSLSNSYCRAANTSCLGIPDRLFQLG
jgi:hypothetical protein